MHCPSLPACIQLSTHGSTPLRELSHHAFVTLRSSASVQTCNSSCLFPCSAPLYTDTQNRHPSYIACIREAQGFFSHVVPQDSSSMLLMPLVLYKLQQPSHKVATSKPSRRGYWDCKQRCPCHAPSHVSSPVQQSLFHKECTIALPARPAMQLHSDFRDTPSATWALPPHWQDWGKHHLGICALHPCPQGSAVFFINLGSLQQYHGGHTDE